jgi:hypothetical protein
MGDTSSDEPAAREIAGCMVERGKLAAPLTGEILRGTPASTILAIQQSSTCGSTARTLRRWN